MDKTNNTPRRRRPSASLIVSVIALCFALMGTAVAAGLAPNSVGSKQLKDGGVKVNDLALNSVTSPKIADFEVANEDLKAGAVSTDKIAENDVQSQDIAADAVGNSELAVTVRTNSVNVAAGATGSVTAVCQPGETPLGGGAGFGGALSSSQPGNGGWFVAGKNTTASVSTLSVFAYCIRN